MPQYVDEAFVVLIHIPVDNGAPQRESYVVGCSTREEAEADLRKIEGRSSQTASGGSEC